MCAAAKGKTSANSAAGTRTFESTGQESTRAENRTDTKARTIFSIFFPLLFFLITGTDTFLVCSPIPFFSTTFTHFAPSGRLCRIPLLAAWQLWPLLQLPLILQGKLRGRRCKHPPRAWAGR